LGEVADLTIGRTPPRGESRFWTDDLTRPFCTIADMPEGGGWFTPGREGVTEAAESEGKAKRVAAGSLLMSFKLTIGRIAFPSEDVFPNEAIVHVQPHDDGPVTKEYLALWLSSQDLAAGSGRAVKGNTLNGKSLKAIPVVYPPLPVQWRIVDLMEHLDNQVNLLRQEEERAKALTEVLRDAAPPSEYVTLGDALTGVDSGYSVKTPGSPPEEGQARVLKISAVHPGAFRASEAKGITAGVAMPESAKVRVGDILISRANTPERVAFCARVREVPPDTYFPDLLWRLVPDETILCADYLEQILASPSVRARLAATSGGSSTSMTKITKRSLRALTIPLPSMLEQERFAQTCLAATGAHRGLLVEIARLSVARDHLLSALLAGQSVIPDSYDELLGVAS